MGLLSEQTESKLGFQEIRELLVGRASTVSGKGRCATLQPLRKPREAARELDRVAECRDLLLYDDSFELAYTGSVDTLLDHAAVPGNWLTTADLFRIVKWLRMIRHLVSYFKTRREKYPNLWKVIERIDWNRQLLEQIEQLVDDRGNIRDDASPKLRSLRRDSVRASSDLRRSLQATLRDAVQRGWSDASEITIRNERMVIPLKADFKGRIKGFIHDVSQSGQTIFVEPSAALELNNRIRQILAEEQNEIIRLLAEATDRLRGEIDALRKYEQVVTRLDTVRAKARLAVDLDAVRPRFDHTAKTFSLVKARHPLLLLKPGMNKDNVVPLSVNLDQDQRIILVSGPNAGGKSVTLKTVGLLQVMLQSGLLVPTDESSEFRWFHAIYIDIGDEQSIQSDLSTYTSHLENMKAMQTALDPQALFLMDEFGSGTDPRLGGAIAEAFLERFVASGAYGIVTTHYGNLKNYADRTQGIVNAAMQFNPSTLSPSYQIDVGVPGRSYAFEIARKVGVEEQILEDATGKIDGGEAYTEELLLKLETQREELEKVLGENQRKNEELRKLLQRNQALSRQMKEQEARILRDAHTRAQGLIDAANAKIENTIREIRESQAEREKTRNLRRELENMLPEPPAAPEPAPPAPQDGEAAPELLPNAEVREGDWVQLKDANSVGEVIQLQGKRAVVTLGEMRVTVKTKNLVRIKRPGRKDRRAAASRGSVMINKKANVTTELRVKGFRVEQALPVVQRFVDDAILAGLKEVRILHGKGTGALRHAIRSYLSSIPEVNSSRDAAVDLGGAGWTVVSLN
ncbi:MAG: Smr/MutS family protein [Bacteroidota bacterium]